MTAGFIHPTSERINPPMEPDVSLIQSMGELVMQRESSEDQLQPHGLRITPVAESLNAAGSSTKKISVAGTLIKERFQALSPNLQADERDSQRAALRDASVRILFKVFGMIPNTEEVDKPFSGLYRQAEADAASVDRSRLGDLAELYENHPAIRVFDTLTAISSMRNDDIVYMRRASLVLLDQHSA